MQNIEQKMLKNAKQHECKKCSFVCSKYSNYLIHLSTRKHNTETLEINMEITKEQKKQNITCSICNTKYATKTKYSTRPTTKK